MAAAGGTVVGAGGWMELVVSKGIGQREVELIAVDTRVHKGVYVFGLLIVSSRIQVRLVTFTCMPEVTGFWIPFHIWLM